MIIDKDEEGNSELNKKAANSSTDKTITTPKMPQDLMILIKKNIEENNLTMIEHYMRHN